MRRLLDALKHTKRWQKVLIAAVALVLVVAVLIIAGVNIPFISSQNAEQELAETDRIIPVRRDSLQNQVAINGSIVFSNDETLVFGSEGFVHEVLVTEGELVTTGQPLVKLDPESAGKLHHAVAQAQVDYQDALTALEEARTQTLAIAEAELAVANAAVQRREARETLNTLLNPEPNTIAEHEATLADAELALHDAQEAYDTLLNPEEHTLAAAEEAVAQAEIALRDSEYALGFSLSDAQTDLRSAEQDFAVATLNLAAAENTTELDEPQETLEQERADYRNTVKKWTGVHITDDELLPPNELFDTLEFVPEEAYSHQHQLFPNGELIDNPATRWNELTVFAWRNLYPGYTTIEVQCENNTLLPDKESDTTNTNSELCMQRDMNNAWDELTAAQDKFDTAQDNHQQDIASATANLIRATTAREEAQLTLDRLRVGASDDQLLLHRYYTARADLDKTQRDLEELANPSPAELNSKRHQVSLATANRNKAVQDLADLLSPEPTAISHARSDLALANARLTDAQAALQRIHDQRDLNITLHEAAVTSAQANVSGATRRYEDSTLKAPFNGFIAKIAVETGQEVERFDEIVQVINTKIVRVEGSVDEIDILSLQRGATATITMDAVPDEVFNGVISSISSTASSQDGIVTFDVKVDLTIPDDITLQEGLSAVASIEAGEISGLIVPDQAIFYNEDNRPYIRVMENGIIAEQPVVLGNGDGFWTIVESGLEEGTQIVMPLRPDEMPAFENENTRGGIIIRGGGGRPPRQ